LFSTLQKAAQMNISSLIMSRGIPNMLKVIQGPKGGKPKKAFYDQNRFTLSAV
jgi:hypothetical protein